MSVGTVVMMMVADDVMMIGVRVIGEYVETLVEEHGSDGDDHGSGESAEDGIDLVGDNVAG